MLFITVSQCYLLQFTILARPVLRLLLPRSATQFSSFACKVKMSAEECETVQENLKVFYPFALVVF